jgi:hypothetical protein
VGAKIREASILLKIDIKSQIYEYETPMSEPRMHLFEYHDGSLLKMMKASAIADMDIWKGNRIVDLAHCLAIRREIGDDIDHLDLKPFHVVRYMKEVEQGRTEHVKEIVDGQHRATVLRDFFVSKGDDWSKYDFDVLVIVKCCKDEQAIIEYFRTLNHTKAIEWQEDPNMIANRFLDALLRRFNSSSKQMIRQGKTRAPYIGVEAVREEIRRRRIGIATKTSPAEWAETIWKAHQEGLAELREAGAVSGAQEAALKAGCVLALFKNMDWLEPS